MSERISKQDGKHVRERIEEQFMQIVRAMPFPIALPVTRDDVKLLGLNYDLIEQADELTKTFDIRRINYFGVWARTGVNEINTVNGKEYNIAYELELPLEKTLPALIQPAKWFEFKAWHPQYMNVLQYIEDRLALEKEIAIAEAYIKNLFDKASSWGQALRVLPSLKYVFTELEQKMWLKPQQRQSRLPKEFVVNYETRSLTGNLIMKYVMTKAANLPVTTIGMTKRKIPVTG